MSILIRCPHCGNEVWLEDGHTCWICPVCKGFIDMLKQDKKIKADDDPKEVIAAALALALALALIAGCTLPETAPARYNCTWTDNNLSWYCLKDGVRFDCQYEARRGTTENGEH